MAALHGATGSILPGVQPAPAASAQPGARIGGTATGVDRYAFAAEQRDRPSRAAYRTASAGLRPDGVGRRRLQQRVVVRIDSGLAVVTEIDSAIRRGAVPATHRPAERAIQIGMRFLEVSDDLEIDPLDLRQIQLFDMNKAQQLLDGTWHVAPALVPGATALRDPDLRPELFLVKTQATADFPGIQHTIENLHVTKPSAMKDAASPQPIPMAYL